MAHTASLGLRAELADLWATALGQPGPRAWRSRQGAAPRASRHPGGHPEAATLSPPAARWNEALGEYTSSIGTEVRSSDDLHGLALDFACSAFRHFSEGVRLVGSGLVRQRRGNAAAARLRASPAPWRGLGSSVARRLRPRPGASRS